MRDSFYQFSCQEIAADFGMEFPDQAGVYETDRVWEHGPWVPVGSSEEVRMAGGLRQQHGVVVGALDRALSGHVARLARHPSGRSRPRP